MDFVFGAIIGAIVGAVLVYFNYAQAKHLVKALERQVHDLRNDLFVEKLTKERNEAHTQALQEELFLAANPRLR